MLYEPGLFHVCVRSYTQSVAQIHAIVTIGPSTWLLAGIFISRMESRIISQSGHYIDERLNVELKMT